MSITVRAATEADLPGIQRLGERVWPPTYRFAGEEYIAHGLATWWSIERLRAGLTEMFTLLAVDDEEIVGVGNLDHRHEPPVIWKLYVDPDRHGQGVGTALLSALLDEAAGPVRLEYVDGNEPAAAFYRARGFVEISREPSEEPGWPDTVWLQR